MNQQMLRLRIRFWLFLLILGLVLSGLTAFPLETELKWLSQLTLLRDSALGAWLAVVKDALVDTNSKYPFLAYGTDWLAFAHLVIALVFIGPWRDPVRNKWVITFGLMACAGVIPLALVAGGIRGIPWGWRLLDCSFGVVGAIPLWICQRAVTQLEAVQR